jgi:pyruvate/2-oxoglutarate dehydrogenase complex dihydrolipoamide dehydrogenase (E3) component
MKILQVEMTNGTTEELSSDTIFINTGTRPNVPGIEGIQSVPFLNSTSIMELDRVPRHLMIVGGGYIGLEFGQMFSRFGSEVTIVHRGAQLVPREDEDVASEVLDILQEDGIEVILNSQPVSVTQEKDRTIAMKIKKLSGNSGSEEMTLKGSHLLLAAGRVPNTDYLNPGKTDVQINEHGFVKVNHRLETTVSGIYAIGDVKGGPAFTHISYDDYRILRTNILEGGNATTKDRVVPYTIFIDPQLGRVGLSEKEARAGGMYIRVAKIPMTYVARALESGETRGLMKAIVDAESDRILGCAILSVEGGELMAIIQTAMMGGVPYTALRDGVFAHPTLAESLNTLFSYFVE